MTKPRRFLVTIRTPAAQVNGKVRSRLRSYKLFILKREQL